MAEPSNPPLTKRFLSSDEQGDITGDCITLRDLFAAFSMMGQRNFEMGRRKDDIRTRSQDDIAAWAYMDADAMLAERAK